MTQFDATKLLSRRATAVEEAAIIRMAQKARDLRAAGRDVVSLTIGEPDFDTPLQIQAAASEAMRRGFTHYAPVAGFPELRAAIARKLGSENGLDYGPNDIVLANGAKQAITNAVFALVEDGDEAILLAPYWIAYEGIVRMAGGKPVVLPSSIDDGFKTSAAHVEASIGPRTKLIFLNSPNNPSGAVHSRDELAALADVVRKHPQVMVIADEIYEQIAFDGPVVSFATLPGMRDRTVTINGFSKAYAMTGWRLGYGAAAEPVARAMAKIQGTFTAGANAFVQQAAIVALASGSEDVARMREIYRRRREIVIAVAAVHPRRAGRGAGGNLLRLPRRFLISGAPCRKPCHRHGRPIVRLAHRFPRSRHGAGHGVRQHRLHPAVLCRLGKRSRAWIGPARRRPSPAFLTVPTRRLPEAGSSEDEVRTSWLRLVTWRCVGREPRRYKPQASRTG